MTTSVKKPQPKKRWAEAEALWALGEVTAEDIAKKLDVSRSAVFSHMKNAGIVKGSRADELRKKVHSKVEEALISDSAIFAQRIKETKEEHYRWSQVLAKFAFNEILTAQRSSTPYSVATPNLKAIESAMNVLSKARQERWAVLGLDRPDAVDTNELPTLVIEELTADQIEELRSRDFNEFEDIDLPTVQEGEQAV
jgi:predicted transcriptional regulator